VADDEGGTEPNCDWWDGVGKVYGCCSNLEGKKKEVGYSSGDIPKLYRFSF
jgi:hypothetical protein